MIKAVEFLNLREARAKVPGPREAMISIVCPSYDPAFTLSAWPKRRVHYLRFDNLVLDLFPENPPYVLFDEQMAEEIVAFTEALHRLATPVTLYVHCLQGSSRSSAVAYWAYRYYGARLPRDFAVRATPNVRVVEVLFNVAQIKGGLCPERNSKLSKAKSSKPSGSACGRRANCAT